MPLQHGNHLLTLSIAYLRAHWEQSMSEAKGLINSWRRYDGTLNHEEESSHGNRR